MTSAPSNGLAFALGSASLYGLNIGYARLASFAGISGATLVVYRVLLMLALVTAFAALWRRSLRVDPQERGVLALLGLCTTFVGVCYLSSVAFIPVAVAAVLFYTFPILIVLASPFVDGTRLTPALFAVVTLAVAGVVFVVGPAAHDLDWRGLALALAASVATATQFFAATRCQKTGLVAKVFWIHVVVLVSVGIFAAVAGSQLAGPLILAGAPLAVAVVIGCYLVGFAFQLMALGRIKAASAGIVYCIEPVIAALAATVILGESFKGLQWLGGALVLIAICANTLVPRR